MLLKLFIENYALIQKLEIDWADGFSVITGETGAGKSILVGALSLILGQRADTSVLFDKETKCIVEGTFRISSYGLENYFLEHELDFDDLLILRREIARNGKSRAFINDTPVNLSQLKELGARLVNVHSQHSITTLNQANFQLEILDDYSSIQQQVQEYREKFRTQKKQQSELTSLKEQEVKLRGDADYLHFLFDELEK
ncbi:MAG: AAA family ATPase, partial [Bacteroidia bacterium]|nr:AAA family ATPase [Bacteroidia bacterium]